MCSYGLSFSTAILKSNLTFKRRRDLNSFIYLSTISCCSGVNGILLPFSADLVSPVGILVATPSTSFWSGDDDAEWHISVGSVSVAGMVSGTKLMLGRDGKLSACRVVSVFNALSSSFCKSAWEEGERVATGTAYILMRRMKSHVGVMGTDVLGTALGSLWLHGFGAGISTSMCHLRVDANSKR